MFGSSRDSIAALRESLDSRTGAGESLAADLFAVASLLTEHKSLRTTLNDTGTPARARAGIVTDLLGSSLSSDGLDVLQQVVAARWSHDGDMVDALEILAAQAALLGAAADGSLDRVEDELFRFGRAVAGAPTLQLVLTDPAMAAERKAAVVADLTGDAAPITKALLAHTVGHLRGRSPVAAVEALSDIAAEQRQRVVAEVSAAVELSDQQRDRLAAALRRITGREVRLNVQIDSDIVGGIVVRVGDEVIDGSVSTRLEQARRAMSA